ncbi:MAG: hypothetical protein HQL03_00060 [Nitrospirae bacterium]|nr:hypothetical protein [Nitrospirota bacterium]MBF0593008.1 hypothetical protein [Nitrospirota bacterium]
MEQECCSFKVTATEDGFKVEIKDGSIKEFLKSMFKNCCPAVDAAKAEQVCCNPGK